MTLRAYRDFDPNDPDNLNPNQEYDTGNDAVDFQGTLLDPNQGRGQQHYGQYDYAYQGQAAVTPKNRMFIVAGVLGLVAIGFAAAFAISARSGSDVPVITADGASYKSKPETPGGIEIPFQDKMVFNRLDPQGQQVQAERLLPPPEEPMTLALQPADREASAPAPKAMLATEEVAATIAKNTKIVVADKPVAEVAVPTAELDKIAPTQGAVPAPINDTSATVAVVPTPKAPAPAEAAEGTYNDAKAAAKVAPVVAKPTPAVTPAVTGGSRIQLGSLPEKAAADRAVAKFTKDYAGMLSGAQLALVKAEIPGKGTFWRVQSQPLERAKAEKICSAIKAKGGACLLAK